MRIVSRVEGGLEPHVLRAAADTLSCYSTPRLTRALHVCWTGYSYPHTDTSRYRNVHCTAVYLIQTNSITCSSQAPYRIIKF